MDLTPHCIEIRALVAFAIHEWFHAGKMTIKQAAKQMHLPWSTAADVLNPPPHAGDQYRDTLGAAIVGVSDRCFLVSGNAPLGVPQGLTLTKTVCLGDSGSTPWESI
jgi:hypothetical protein